MKARALDKATPLSVSMLHALERGTRGNPKPRVLNALAALYGISQDELIRRITTERFSAGDRGTESAGSRPLEVDVDGQADRIRDLEERIVAYQEIVAALGLLAETARNIASGGPEGRPPVQGQRRRRRSDRDNDR